MKHILLFLASYVLGVATYGQGYSLSCYIKAAKQYSPLLHDYRHQLQIEQAELRRLKALYTRSRLELNGDYLFVPVQTGDKLLSDGTHRTPRIIMATTWARVAGICMPEPRGHSRSWDIRLTKWHRSNPASIWIWPATTSAWKRTNWNAR